MPEPTPVQVRPLHELVEGDALSGEVVTAKLLACRWGGCPRVVEAQLDRLVAQGRLRKRLKRAREGRKMMAYTIYWKPRKETRA